MAYLPTLQEAQTSRLVTDTFYGFDASPKAPDGTWADEIGLSSDKFPLFGVRKRRSYMDIGAGGKVTAAIAKDKLAWIEEKDGKASLMYDGVKVDVPITTGAKQLVSMGAYLCIFPDGVYVNTHDLKDTGKMGNRFKPGPRDLDLIIELAMCNVDGKEYEVQDAAISSVEPKEPKNGDYWIDSTETPHILKRYSVSAGQWVAFTTTYVRIGMEGIGEGFRVNDAVRISGIHAFGENSTIARQVEALNGDFVIQACDTDWIVIVGVLDKHMRFPCGNIDVERRVPKLDYVCEMDNRLWGCRYGMDEGQNVNTIYACAQGDPRNWYRYEGIASDSYAVNVGSDGPFTGIVPYGGYVLAWKENGVHKIYGTLPSNFTLSTTQCRGVAAGCGDTLQVVNERLYYMSRSGACVYDGTLPQSISDVFSGKKYTEGRTGVIGNRYVVCMKRQGPAGEAGRERPEAALMSGGEAHGFRKEQPWEVWCFDADHGIWHHLFDDEAKMFFPLGDDLVYVSADGKIVCLDGTTGEKEGPVEFDAISGMIGYEYPDRKYLSRFNIRLKMGHGDQLEILTRYDSDGPWEYQGEIRVEATNSFTVPVIPRRCDHMQLRLRGRGNVYIYNITKILEVGSDAE